MPDERSTHSGGLRRIDPTAALAELPVGRPGDGALHLGRVWAAAVGEAVAAHTWPARVARDGTVVVHCSSSVWASELELMGRSLATRLQDALGEPEARVLRFRLGPMPHRAPPAPAAPRAPEPDEATRAQAALLAAAVDDAELRAAVERAIAGRLMRGAPGQAERARHRGREGGSADPSGILPSGSEALRHRR
jgi:hypothetical protein